ncbi:sugar phosphate isomerase/epimerase family protein [Microbacterium halotolerans]|uniref:sugar phosphate isomerase/epimerase family protein n=1 Tax=Microbacterium halotolerans TaxID=246613 RepID=UPI000E6AB09A|nr:TIM barrel protein [Microbacterium halotolerans]
MIGLGSYAYFWRRSDRVERPLTLIDEFEDASAHDVGLFQICDYAPLERMNRAELREAASAARDNGLTIELGTKGIAPEHLERYLRLAEIFDASLVRSMVSSPGSDPTLGEASSWLHDAIRSFESAGVTLALETYEQIATADLVRLVEAIGSDELGICLDPANVVARLERPAECVAASSPHVKNVHVKDFAFARQDGWVGFTYSGAPMGQGLHDYEHLLQTVRPRERGINEIVEHWLPWQSDAPTTIAAEREWTRTALDYLRRTQ